MKKITAVIPVYNSITSGGGHINRCVDSVLQQDFDLDDIEILLINDGSTDGSLVTLLEYESAHPTVVRVINQENMGVARTRNRAIDCAIGEYIVFLDQDDWIDPDFLVVLHQAVDEGLDFVISGYRRPSDRGEVKYTISPPETEYGKYMVNAAWAKIHRTSFLREHGIYFFDNRYGEDTIFTRREIVASNKSKIIRYVGYNWYYNETSVSSTTQKGLQYTDSFIKLLEERLRIGDLDRRYVTYDLLKISIFHLLFSGKNTTRAHFMVTYKTVFSWLNDNVPDLYRVNHLPAGPAGEKLKAVIGINAFTIIHKLRLMSIFAKVYCRHG